MKTEDEFPSQDAVTYTPFSTIKKQVRKKKVSKQSKKERISAKSVSLAERLGYANAIDIVSFRSEDGKRYTVKRDWLKDSKVSKFLKGIAVKACQSFSLTLTPNSDRAHADHFHLDNGLYMGGDC